MNVDPQKHVRARLLPPEIAVTTHDEVQATYTPEQAIAEAKRAIEAGFDLEAAREGCPFKVDIPTYFRKVIQGDFDGALAVILKSHPFPSTFGRMCHLFCQQATPPLEDLGKPWPDWTPPEWQLAEEYGAEGSWARGRPNPPGGGRGGDAPQQRAGSDSIPLRPRLDLAGGTVLQQMGGGTVPQQAGGSVPPELAGPDLTPRAGRELADGAPTGVAPATGQIKPASEGARDGAAPAQRPVTATWATVANSIRGVGHGSGILDGGGIERPAFLLMERFVGDYGDPAASPVVAEKPPSGKRVAVIGAGSGGLANAWMLRRLGHEVDIYDALQVPGGTLFAGYPPHRMAKFGVRRENDPTTWGARFFGGRELTRADIEAIIEQYDLTFLSIGKFEPLMVGIPGENAQGVWNALYFIAEVGYGRWPARGGRCVMFGAGHTASDAAQVARRLGCQIKIFYRRGLDEMPLDGADPTEHVSRMSEDGIEYHFLAQPVRILADDENRVTGVEFVATKLGAPDASGRKRPEPIPGSNFVEPCDIVVEAIGEAIDLRLVPDSLRRDGPVVWVDRSSHRTSHPKVFAGGDLIGDRGNDGAAHSGILAAYTMDSILRDEPVVLFEPRPIR